MSSTRPPTSNERFVALHSAKISNHRDAHQVLYALDESGLVWEYGCLAGYGTGADPYVWGWSPLSNERENK